MRPLRMMSALSVAASAAAASCGWVQHNKTTGQNPYRSFQVGTEQQCRSQCCADCTCAAASISHPFAGVTQCALFHGRTSSTSPDETLYVSQGPVCPAPQRYSPSATECVPGLGEGCPCRTDNDCSKRSCVNTTSGQTCGGAAPKTADACVAPTPGENPGASKGLNVMLVVSVDTLCDMSVAAHAAGLLVDSFTTAPGMAKFGVASDAGLVAPLGYSNASVLLGLDFLQMGSDLYSALAAAEKELSGADGYKAVVLLTSTGYDASRAKQASDPTVVAAGMLNDGVELFTIAIAAGTNFDTVQMIASSPYDQHTFNAHVDPVTAIISNVTKTLIAGKSAGPPSDCRWTSHDNAGVADKYVYSTVKAADAKACQDACCADRKCKGAALLNGECKLHSLAAPKTEEAPGSTLWRKYDRTGCDRKAFLPFQCAFDGCSNCNWPLTKCQEGFTCGCPCDSSDDCDRSQLDLGCSTCTAGRCRSPHMNKACSSNADCSTVAGAHNCSSGHCLPSSPDTPPEHCIPPVPGQPHKNCSVKMDLVFLLDGSGSVYTDAWKELIRFTANIGLNFSTGDVLMQYSVVQFSDKAQTFMKLKDDNSTFQQTLRVMQQFRSSTNTAAGVAQVAAELDARARPGSFKVVIIMTDGYWNSGGDPVVLSECLQANDTHVFTVAIGAAAAGNVKALASKPLSKYYFNVTDEKYLPDTLRSMIESICQRDPVGPTPPPAPIAQTCGKNCTADKDCSMKCQASECSTCVATSSGAKACGVGCGGKCTEDSHCIEAGCGTCVEGTCGVPCSSECTSHSQCVANTCLDCVAPTKSQKKTCSLGCGRRCTADGECGAENCTSCVQGTCGAGCGGACADNSQCAGDCSVCSPAGICGKNCGEECKVDSDCAYALCAACIDGKCSAAKCGERCSVNANCQQHGSNCTHCIESQCAAPCGGNCGSTAECHGDCAFCSVFGKCIHQNTCLGSCRLNEDCKVGGSAPGGSDCDICVVKTEKNGTVTGRCSAYCGRECNDDSVCLDGDCPYCTHGKCQNHVAHKCGETCRGDLDCEGECTICRSKSSADPVCGAGCGSNCTSDEMCVDINCPQCHSDGKCGPFHYNHTCGGNCTTNLDCHGECTLCMPAPSGNGSECGSGCGGSCTADSDCLDKNCMHCTGGKCANAWSK